MSREIRISKPLTRHLVHVFVKKHENVYNLSSSRFCSTIQLLAPSILKKGATKAVGNILQP